jgi:hypothetical protein
VCDVAGEADSIGEGVGVDGVDSNKGGEANGDRGRRGEDVHACLKVFLVRLAGGEDGDDGDGAGGGCEGCCCGGCGDGMSEEAMGPSFRQLWRR